MLTIPPSCIGKSLVIGAPLNYKWSDNIAMKIDDAENDRLYGAIDATNFKAKFAVGIMLTEWIVWRLQGQADVTDALQRVEAAWAGVVHPAYMSGLDFTSSRDSTENIVLGPLEFALDNLADMATDYAKGYIYLAQPIMRQALLAAHLMPDKKTFEQWLSTTLKSLAKSFPRGVDYDEDTEYHDASGEAPVPREFFDPSFTYSEETAHQAWTAFLRSLDPAANPYLRPGLEMLKEGFPGTPYTFS